MNTLAENLARYLTGKEVRSIWFTPETNGAREMFLQENVWNILAIWHKNGMKEDITETFHRYNGGRIDIISEKFAELAWELATFLGSGMSYPNRRTFAFERNSTV